MKEPCAVNRHTLKNTGHVQCAGLPGSQRRARRPASHERVDNRFQLGSNLSDSAVATKGEGKELRGSSSRSGEQPPDNNYCQIIDDAITFLQFGRELPEKRVPRSIFQAEICEHFVDFAPRSNVCLTLANLRQ